MANINCSTITSGTSTSIIRCFGLSRTKPNDYKLKRQKFNYDVIDDAHVHMKNDRDFYRKEYYPAMCKIAELTKGRKVFDPKMIMMPLVDKGVNSYCKKYNIAKMPDEVFKKDHRQALYDKIYSEEIEQINNGEYI